MFIAMITWGIAWTNAKILSDYLNYYNLVFLRFLFGFLSLLPFVYKKINTIPKIPPPVFLNITFMGILFFIYNYCFFKGTDLGHSGFGGVLVTTTNPIITFIIISIISKKITLNQFFGIILGLIGGLLIMDIFNMGLLHLLNIQNKYYITCSIIWGLMTVIMSFGQKKIDSILYIAICYLFTTIISIFFIDVNELLQIIDYDFRFYFNFVSVSIGAMSFGTSIYIYATPRLGPIQTSAFIFTVPFIALLTAFIVLKEPITYNVIIGGIISILAIVFINRNKT
tara:strand:- start:212 stop:1057 length:846 start_codon:yes stop_codon:yes gene_type:complete